MSAKLVSVIMPAYQSHGFILNSINSVLCQTYPHWELIVISDDGTEYIIPENDRIKLLSTNKSGSGPSISRNLGIEKANGDIIATLDSDDYFHPQKLELMVGKCIEYGLVTCSLKRQGVNGNKIPTANCIQKSGSQNINDYLATNFSSNSHIMFDRKFDLKYPEYLNYLEDLTLPVMFFDQCERSYHFEAPLHIWTKRDDSVSNKPGAPKDFIAAKKLILNKLKNKSFGLKSADVSEAYRDFVTVSLNCEKIFDDQVELGINDIDFTDIFINELSKLYPKKEYAYKNKTYINGKIKPN